MISKRTTANSVIIGNTVLLVFIMTLLSCNEPLATSAWKNRVKTVSIDGNEIDWKDDLYSLNKKNENLGVLNDDSCLYLCFASYNSNLNRVILRGGLTLWFEHPEIKKNRVGIHLEGGFRHRRWNEEERAERGPEVIDKKHNEILNTIEILGPNPEDRRIISSDSAAAAGLIIGMHKEIDKVVCEIKLPLHHQGSAMFPLGVVHDSLLKVTLESAPQDPHRYNPSGRQLGEGGEHHGRPGGGHHNDGTGSSYGEHRNENSRSTAMQGGEEQLKMKVQIQLAFPPENRGKKLE